MLFDIAKQHVNNHSSKSAQLRHSDLCNVCRQSKYKFIKFKKQVVQEGLCIKENEFWGEIFQQKRLLPT